MKIDNKKITAISAVKGTVTGGEKKPFLWRCFVTGEVLVCRIYNSEQFKGYLMGFKALMII
jgi:hypothetical protein